MNHAGVSSPAVAVISPQFCAGDSIELTIVRKMMTLSEGNFVVTDVNGKVMFTVKGKLFSLHERRVLLDAAGNAVLTYKQKLMSAHRRWQAFRGGSTDAKDMLFSVRKSTLLQIKSKLDVFLASNTTEEVADFRIEGSLFENTCVIYAGGEANPDKIIVQMHRNHSVKSVLLGKDSFAVTVYPNVDYAFAASLILLLEEINEERQNS